MNGISGCIRTSGVGQKFVLADCRQSEIQDRSGLFHRDGLCIYFAGEIYNPTEAQIGMSDSLRNDAALRIAELYDRRGPRFVEELTGSFVLALCDAKAQRVLLAVDPFATRPLYYAFEKEVLAFASRLSDLLVHPEIPRDIDPNAIYFYLNHSHIPAPSTVYRHIRRLQPGQMIVWQNNSLTSRQYWDLRYEEDRGLSESEAGALIRETVEDAVRVRLEHGAGQASAGAFLSGGTDSSTLVGLMTKIRGKRVKTFSVGFCEERYNEIEYARIAARHFDSESYERFVNAREALELIPRLAEIYDEPFGNSSTIPTYFCLKSAREAGVTVMFSGDGGDELFAGNERYVSEKIFSFYQQVPDWLRQYINPAVEKLPSVYPLVRARNYIRRSNRPNPERFFSYHLYLRDHASDFFTDDFLQAMDDKFLLRIAEEYYRKVESASWINKLLYLDMKLAIADNDLIKVNRVAESLGVSVRYPYLDTRLAAVTGKIPSYLKLKGFTKRYIFKKAFQDLLPPEILRKRKHGFGLPVGEWLRGDEGFRDLARSLLLDSRSIRRGYFQPAALEKLLEDHDRESSSFYGTFIWNFMMLELWHRNHSDGRFRSAQTA